MCTGRAEREEEHSSGAPRSRVPDRQRSRPNRSQAHEQSRFDHQESGRSLQERKGEAFEVKDDKLIP